MTIWHRHEKEHGADDDGTGMEHAHEGGDVPHPHPLPDQAVFNNYIGTIDEPDTSGKPTVDDPAIAAGEANDAAAETGELGGDDIDEAEDDADEEDDEDA